MPQSGRTFRILPSPVPGTREDLTGMVSGFSPDGRFILTGAGFAATWAAASLEPGRWLQRSVKACARSPDGRFVVSGLGRAVTVWHPSCGQ